MPHIIALSGGIGCGKSLVSKILSYFGFYVYDCDSNAKKLMDSDSEIKLQIAEKISPKAIDQNGAIDRKILSDIVFNDSDKLSILNSIVHTSVKNDISKWIELYSSQRTLFIETAILYQSGLDKMVDEVWEIKTPTELQISRVMKRNNLSKTAVEARIQSQKLSNNHPKHKNIKIIINDNNSPILPQLYALIEI